MSAARPSRQERWRARNPVADWAHSATKAALRRGIIKRQACEICGAEPADAHHPDYNRPLFILWRCRRHHKAEHAKAKRGNGS